MTADIISTIGDFVKWILDTVKNSLNNRNSL